MNILEIETCKYPREEFSRKMKTKPQSRYYDTLRTSKHGAVAREGIEKEKVRSARLKC